MGPHAKVLSSEASVDSVLVVPGSKPMEATAKQDPPGGGTFYISSISTKPWAHSRCSVNTS